MKTRTKLLALLIFVCAGISSNQVSAQAYAYGTALFGPPRGEVQTATGIMAITTGTGTGAGTALTALGVNQTNPQYMLDILCTSSSNQDVNISCTSCALPNSVGYRIGSNMFAWHDGDITSAYIGVGAGFAPNNYTSGTYYLNTFVGYYADVAFNGAGGTNNTAIGCEALSNNTYGAYNTAVGNQALYTQSFANGNSAYNTYNTALGCQALYKNQPTSASGIGNGNYNTGVGYQSLYSNTTGYNNSGFGVFSLINNTTGYANAANGNQALTTNTTGSFNAGSGDEALQLNTTGSYNTGMGMQALQSNTTGSYNSALGFESDVSATGLTYATAIGALAHAAQNNDMVLGNDSVNVTIGLSGRAFSNVTRLRINTQYGGGTFTVTPTSAPPSYVNSGRGTGWSGLRFDDLTSGSTPGKNPGPGYLSVDTAGNIIYVDTAFANGIGFGLCSNAPSFTANAGLNLNTYNLYFEGNSSGALNENDVLIGYSCGTTPIKAKFNVLQNSGATITSVPSMCAYFENDDAAACDLIPVIGIESRVKPNSGVYQENEVAGWFQADSTENCSGSYNQYAILVPVHGGNVEIGVQATSITDVHPANSYLLDVYGSGALSASYTTSDSTLKTNIAPIKNQANALSIIEQLNGVSFNYKKPIITDSGMAGTHYGFIAQDLALVLPNAVRTDNRHIEGVAYTEIVPWLVEGMKQQIQTNDSLRSTLDSLRSAFQNIQNCLSQLCPNLTHSAIHNNGGGSGDSVTSIQNITLSSGNSALLYQNIPNPFSTGTKINYYLPQGIVGAIIVFYDSYGNQIKTVQLNQTGNGTLNITPDNLTSGIYSYSLVINGTIIDTKRMVLQK